MLLKDPDHTATEVVPGVQNDGYAAIRHEIHKEATSWLLRSALQAKKCTSWSKSWPCSLRRSTNF